MNNSPTSNNPSRQGILFVLSAPSGAGKTTLTSALRQCEPLHYSVSCTTRAPRSGEVDGQHYHFLSPTDFQNHLAADAFLESAEVHGHHYGTLRDPVLSTLHAGHDILIDVDTRGAALIRECPHPTIREALVDIFLLPPSIEELSRRLRSRGTESESQIATRLRNAENEIRQWPAYRYAITGGSPEEVLSNFRSIMRAEHLATRRLSYP